MSAFPWKFRRLQLEIKPPFTVFHHLLRFACFFHFGSSCTKLRTSKIWAQVFWFFVTVPRLSSRKFLRGLFLRWQFSGWMLFSADLFCVNSKTFDSSVVCSFFFVCVSFVFFFFIYVFFSASGNLLKRSVEHNNVETNSLKSNFNNLITSVCFDNDHYLRVILFKIDINVLIKTLRNE